MTDDERAYQAYELRKALKLTRPALDCGHPGEPYQHIWCDRLACRECADLDHDCSAFGGVKDGTGKVPEPAGTASDLDAWTVAMQHWIEPGDVARAAESLRRYRCRGCRLWIARDVKLCGPCSALPPCLAERSAAEWGGLVVCFRPDGHDGQHESVQGRCWMDPPVETARLPLAPVEASADPDWPWALTPTADARPDCRDVSDIATRRPWWKPRFSDLQAALKSRRTRRGGTDA